MKKIIIYTLIFLSAISLYAFASAVDCQPTFNRDYTVETTCTWPGNYKVYGDIIVGNKTVSVPTGRVVGVNLVAEKVTFTTGKMLFTGTAKMDNSVSTRYYKTYSFSSASGVTNCPAGYEVLNTTPSNYQGGTRTGLASSGSFYCGK